MKDDNNKYQSEEFAIWLLQHPFGPDNTMTIKEAYEVFIKK